MSNSKRPAWSALLGPEVLSALLLAALCFGAARCWLGRDPGRASTASAGALELGAALGGAADGFLRAQGPRTFEFPADHGPHPGFRTEWWYLTGNLASESGRAFGFQVTFFRQALAAEAPGRSASGAASALWMAHLALTDPQAAAGRRFRSAERFAREALELAGARAEPWSVWVGPWSLEARPGTDFAISLQAEAEHAALALELVAERAPLLQGQAGLSQKGPEPGNASYYYSITRLATQGTLVLDGERFQVTGSSWLDREWSTSALSSGVVGWDWFALQLDDGSDLMLYQLRLADGSSSPFSQGSFCTAQGRVQSLGRSDFELRPLADWTSAHSGVRYPVRWALAVPSLQLKLELEPLVEEQELLVSLLYWEGAIRARGTRQNQPLAARGYMELTGYQQQPQAQR